MKSREQAVDALAAGRVRLAGSAVVKPSTLVAADQPLELLGEPPRFVSRGGEKLDAALERFAVDVAGRRVLDAGASTGGFSDCALQRGAASVVAVDVGRAQLHERIRSDPRVRVLESTNVRHLGLEEAGGAPFDVVLADLSFISLRTVMPVLAGHLAAPGADLVLLAKPQFEVGRREASRGRGIIRDPDLWRSALDGVCSALTGAGAAIIGVMVSPLRGAEGNVEFLIHAKAHAVVPATPGRINPSEAGPRAAPASACAASGEVAVQIEAALVEAGAESAGVVDQIQTPSPAGQES